MLLINLTDLMKNTKPTLPEMEKFEWAIFLYNILTKYDTAYVDARTKLASAEKANNFNEIGREVLKFVNKWKSRVAENEGKTKDEISAWYKKNSDKLQKLNRNLLDLKDEDYDTIREWYLSIKIDGIGPTTISKVLHILKPKLFVAWDTEIAKKYGFKHDAYGYVDFIKEMKRFAEVITGWRDGNEVKYLTEKIKGLYEQGTKEETDPEVSKSPNDRITFLDAEGIELTKLIGEYNWVIMTNKIIVPPKWHPE